MNARGARCIAGCWVAQFPGCLVVQYLGNSATWKPGNYTRALISTSAPTAASISISVVNRDNENRTVLFASSGDKPIASSTRLGSTRPDEQADPVDAAIPARSSAITIPSASPPRNVTLLV